MKKTILTKFRTEPIILYLYNIESYYEYSYGFSKNDIDKHEKGLNYCIDKICRNLVHKIKGEWEYTIVIIKEISMGKIKYDYIILDKKEIIND